VSLKRHPSDEISMKLIKDLHSVRDTSLDSTGARIVKKVFQHFATFFEALANYFKSIVIAKRTGFPMRRLSW